MKNYANEMRWIFYSHAVVGALLAAGLIDALGRIV